MNTNFLCSRLIGAFFVLTIISSVTSFADSRCLKDGVDYCESRQGRERNFDDRRVENRIDDRRVRLSPIKILSEQRAREQLARNEKNLEVDSDHHRSALNRETQIREVAPTQGSGQRDESRRQQFEQRGDKRVRVERNDRRLLERNDNRNLVRSERTEERTRERHVAEEQRERGDNRRSYQRARDIKERDSYERDAREPSARSFDRRERTDEPLERQERSERQQRITQQERFERQDRSREHDRFEQRERVEQQEQNKLRQSPPAKSHNRETERRFETKLDRESRNLDLQSEQRDRRFSPTQHRDIHLVDLVSRQNLNQSEQWASGNLAWYVLQTTLFAVIFMKLYKDGDSGKSNWGKFPSLLSKSLKSN